MLKRSVTMLALAAAMFVISVPALAAPTTMQLSSWTPEFANEAITGGIRTVTVTNVTDETVVNLSVALDPAPCDCSIRSSEASRGTLARLDWTIDRLEPGATATLTIRYQDAAAVVAGSPGLDSTLVGGIVGAVLAVLLLAGAFLSRPDRFGVNAS